MQMRKTFKKFENNLVRCPFLHKKYKSLSIIMKAQLINTAMILSVLAINLSCSDKSGTTPIPVPEPSTEQAPSQPVSAAEPAVAPNTSGNPSLTLIEERIALPVIK
jgi:hypothetical protein